MKRTAVALFALLLGCPALGQQLAAPAPQPFAPFTVDEKAYTEIVTYLRQQPYMFSAPLIQWLEQAEAAALRAARVAPAENAPPTPEAK